MIWRLCPKPVGQFPVSQCYVKAVTKTVSTSWESSTGPTPDQRTQCQGSSPAPFPWKQAEVFRLPCHGAGLLEMYLGDLFGSAYTALLSLLGTFPQSSAPRTQPAKVSSGSFCPCHRIQVCKQALMSWDQPLEGKNGHETSAF